MNKARETVLKLLSEGKITIEEAEELLDAITGGSKGIFNNFFAGKQATKAGARQKETGKDKEGRDEFRFDFHFPWDEPGWQWPWEREGWQWPWEKPGSPWSQRGRSSSTFEVPEEARLLIKSGDGNLTIQSTDDPALRLSSISTNNVKVEDKVIYVSSGDGDLNIEAPSKVIYIGIEQNKGNVDVKGLNSDLLVKVADGILSISKVNGKIEASLENGNLWLTDIRSKEISTHLHSGSISLTMLPTVNEGSFDLSVDIGRISLLLPPNSQCQITANAEVGSINHSLPPESAEIIDKTSNHLEVKLNGGGANFALSVGTGDISIKA